MTHSKRSGHDTYAGAGNSTLGQQTNMEFGQSIDFGSNIGKRF